VDFVRGIGDNTPVKPARTSSRELHELFTGLSLDVELDLAASNDFSTVTSEVISWYADPARAGPAKVFVLFDEQEAPRELLAEWIGRPLPADAEGFELLSYAADALLCEASHGGPTAPELLTFELDHAGLYLLRPAGQRRNFGTEGWVPSTLNSPDTEAALNGVFRFEGCTPGFAEHAARCKTCLAALHAWDEKHGLPDGFEAFRIRPPRPPPPAHSGKPAEGVAIVIPRPPEEPAKPAPWWKFWA
jgi:hypothetical protein